MKYTAVHGKSLGRIISVDEENPITAMAEITRQLNRRGREEIYKGWIETGARFIVDDCTDMIFSWRYNDIG